VVIAKLGIRSVAVRGFRPFLLRAGEIAFHRDGQPLVAGHLPTFFAGPIGMHPALGSSRPGKMFDGVERYGDVISLVDTILQ
jgi:hypothetical protein